MGVSPIDDPLSFRQRIITRGGNPIRLYYIYEDEIHGAYETDDRWYIARWNYNGKFLDPLPNGKQPISTLDLINDE
jgi:hypothetical protein